jgi:hypothetical protein
VRLVVIGDIHTQEAKFWRVLQELGLADSDHLPSSQMADTHLILLGDLVHAKSRKRYADLTRVRRYDEYNPKHIRRAEDAQVAFLKRVKLFQESLSVGQMTIIMGNHDFNAIQADQGPLRTDDVSHLEWKDGYGNPLEPDLKQWMSSWPFELVVEGIHFAHVGPLAAHNTFDSGFYLENRRRWIYEDEDFLAGTAYQLGVYGHTPVRGGVNIASQGRAILLDTNGHLGEYCYLVITLHEDRYHLNMRGLFFDEIILKKTS